MTWRPYQKRKADSDARAAARAGRTAFQIGRERRRRVDDEAAGRIRAREQNERLAAAGRLLIKDKAPRLIEKLRRCEPRAIVVSGFKNGRRVGVGLPEADGEYVWYTAPAGGVWLYGLTDAEQSILTMMRMIETALTAVRK